MNKNLHDTPNQVKEKAPVFGFVHHTEEEKLLEDILRPDIEKLQLFTKMLHRNAVLKTAIITHNK